MNEGNTWEKKYNEVQVYLKRIGWNDVARQLDNHVRVHKNDDEFDSLDDLYCKALSIFDEVFLSYISGIIRK